MLGLKACTNTTQLFSVFLKILFCYAYVSVCIVNTWVHVPEKATESVGSPGLKLQAIYYELPNVGAGH